MKWEERVRCVYDVVLALTLDVRRVGSGTLCCVYTLLFSGAGGGIGWLGIDRPHSVGVCISYIVTSPWLSTRTSPSQLRPPRTT